MPLSSLHFFLCCLFIKHIIFNIDSCTSCLCLCFPVFLITLLHSFPPQLYVFLPSLLHPLFFPSLPSHFSPSPFTQTALPSSFSLPFSNHRTLPPHPAHPLASTNSAFPWQGRDLPHKGHVTTSAGETFLCLPVVFCCYPFFFPLSSLGVSILPSFILFVCFLSVYFCFDINLFMPSVTFGCISFPLLIVCFFSEILLVDHLFVFALYRSDRQV